MLAMKSRDGVDERSGEVGYLSMDTQCVVACAETDKVSVGIPSQSQGE